jgi:hypothetical protein
VLAVPKVDVEVPTNRSKDALENENLKEENKLGPTESTLKVNVLDSKLIDCGLLLESCLEAPLRAEIEYCVHWLICVFALFKTNANSRYGGLAVEEKKKKKKKKKV